MQFLTRLIPFFVVLVLSFLFWQERQSIQEKFLSPLTPITPLSPTSPDVVSDTGRVINLGFGTGFFVNEKHVITNQHVVQDCKSFTVVEPKNLRTTLNVLATDKYNDLAVLVSEHPPKNIAVLRAHMEGVKAGAPVSVIGYPGGAYAFKKGSVLNPDERTDHGPPELDQPFTERKIVLTDTVRKGNSGGPLLDEYGNVIGVIEGFREIEETTLAELDGKTEVVATEHFTNGSAVHLARLRAFLDYYKIRYYLSLREAGYLPDANLEQYANQFTVQIRCIK
ncbi:MAG: trypsin-like serine protease [Rickettsiales bacterium]|jgi:hypothetical protein|nr:trypsin-like serine protease [Rickettsiales bacterium]